MLTNSTFLLAVALTFFIFGIGRGGIGEMLFGILFLSMAIIVQNIENSKGDLK